MMLATATNLCAPAFAAAAGTRLKATSAAPLVVVEGRVLDVDRNPVASARVGIFRNLNPDNAPCPRGVKPESCLEYLFSISAGRAHAVTGEDGRYTLQVPEASCWTRMYSGRRA